MQEVSPEALTDSLGKRSFFARFPNFLHARATERTCAPSGAAGSWSTKSIIRPLLPRRWDGWPPNRSPQSRVSKNSCRTLSPCRKSRLPAHTTSPTEWRKTGPNRQPRFGQVDASAGNPRNAAPRSRGSPAAVHPGVVGSGGHLGCRRAVASCPAGLACNLDATGGFHAMVRAAGCAPSTAARMAAATVPPTTSGCTAPAGPGFSGRSVPQCSWSAGYLIRACP